MCDFIFYIISAISKFNEKLKNTFSLSLDNLYKMNQYSFSKMFQFVTNIISFCKKGNEFDLKLLIMIPTTNRNAFFNLSNF